MSPMKTKPSKQRDDDPAFDVALSFAGEDRTYVSKVAEELKKMGIKVFYDKYEQVSLWGKNLYDHLSVVYGKTSRYTVVFISNHYARKLWTNHERQSAQARAFSEQREYILPARFDDTEIPGMHATIGYINLKNVSPQDFARLIKEKVGPIYRKNFMPNDPDRLWDALGANTDDERWLITAMANDVFRALSLMTPQERELLATFARHTCPTGPALENNIHININLLARISKLEPKTILATLSRIECLGFTHKMTSHKKGGIKNIVQLRYEPLNEQEEISGNKTVILFEMFECVGTKLCPNCAAAAIERLDFSILSTLAGFPDSTHSRNATQEPAAQNKSLRRQSSSASTKQNRGERKARTKKVDVRRPRRDQ